MASEVVHARALLVAVKGVTVVSAELGNEAPAIGAAELARFTFATVT